MPHCRTKAEPMKAHRYLNTVLALLALTLAVIAMDPCQGTTEQPESTEVSEP